MTCLVLGMKCLSKPLIQLRFKRSKKYLKRYIKKKEGFRYRSQKKRAKKERSGKAQFLILDRWMLEEGRALAGERGRFTCTSLAE
jgi:hypothetical protein